MKYNDDMPSNFFFIGGIHGVGKSTICKKLCEDFSIEHLSASKVLKWSEVAEDSSNKLIKDVETNQNRLLSGLSLIAKPGITYLLDGHYCLINEDRIIVKVPIETFYKINPISLFVVTGDIIEIKSRLEKRDNRYYDSSLLTEMQYLEVDYAGEIAKSLGVNLRIGTLQDYSDIKIDLCNFKKYT